MQAARDIGHMEWALIGTMSIAEKQQSDVALSLRPEIKHRTGCIGESEFQQIAKDVKDGCPVGKALKGTEIAVDASLTKTQAAG